MRRSLKGQGQVTKRGCCNKHRGSGRTCNEEAQQGTLPAWQGAAGARRGGGGTLWGQGQNGGRTCYMPRWPIKTVLALDCDLLVSLSRPSCCWPQGLLRGLAGMVRRR